MAALDADLASGLRHSERQDIKGELQLEYTIFGYNNYVIVRPGLTENGYKLLSTKLSTKAQQLRQPETELYQYCLLITQFLSERD